MIDRRKFLSIGLIGLSSVALSACSLGKKQKAVEYYHEEAHGIIDTTGRWVIEPKFDWISTPVKGLCTASLFKNKDLLSENNDELCGIVDLSGEWVIEPKWKDVGSLSELDYFGAQDAKSGLWGIARKDGSWQVEPYLGSNERYSTIGTFNAHTQRAKAYDATSDLWGFIDGSGKWVVKPFASRISYIGADGLYAATKKDIPLYGLIDIEGNWVLEPKFRLIGAFGKTGYAYAESVETELVGLIDKQGNWVVEPKFSYMGPPNKSDFIPAEEYIEGKRPGDLLWGFVDLSGEWVVEPKYLDVRPYNEKCDIVPVLPKRRNLLYRLMNSKEEFVSDACFSYISSGFSDEGYCSARPYKLEKPSEE
ncbi:WG repeat-containing protein [Lancefieldella rimae]|uniref:WG repeat-containing protein n=1 Tax=Lancefieldella rimae TaxID=1383 RepID=UPI0028899A05|nr:WG repeat-containing protein [Lancefieldella rimae]